MKLESIGLIINPNAGRGAEANLAIAGQAIKSIGAKRILTGPGQLGELAVAKADVRPVSDLAGRAVTRWLADEAASAGVDALVVVGGDGTLADAAFAILEGGHQCPILGIGAGSTNVGDLITCRADELANLDQADFVTESLHALIALCNDQILALAFNDVVIGSTVLGTLEGNVVDLDATALLEGEKTPGQPQSIATTSALVTKASGDKVVQVAQGPSVGTIIAGFAHQNRFYGKAIVGGVCLTSLVGLPAGCLVCEQPIVRMHLERSDLEAQEPLRSAYVSLSEADAIHVAGVSPPAVLCADGNPLVSLQPGDVAQIRVRMNAVDVLRVAL